MALELDFNKLKRDYLRITLNDKNKTVLDVKLATKSTVVKLMEVYKDIADLDSATIDDIKKRDILDDLFNICSILLSYNKQNKTITKAQLAKLWDLEFLTAFVNIYLEFIEEVTNKKN